MALSARFLTVIAFLAVGFVFAPDVFGSRPESAPLVATLAHLLCFATSWGAGLWVTFLGGMASSCSRICRGTCLGISVSAAASVAAFAYLHPWRSATSVEKYHLGFLLSALGFNLSNLLVFAPMTTEKRHKVERDLSWSKNVEVAKTKPTLASMNKKFRMIHGLSSLAGQYLVFGPPPHAFLVPVSIATMPTGVQGGFLHI